mmetsp:Transcript_13219/g.31688  ORF Transcript_13219/g.31688 Transcript_13219/m.31688 type:complete len:647 (+) Transcript_13219:72-2012(+)
MSIRIQGGRSTTTLLGKGKAHHRTTRVLKLLLLALVFIFIIGVLKSPNPRLVLLSADDSSQHEAAVISRPKETPVTLAVSNEDTNKRIAKNKDTVDHGLLSSTVTNQHSLNNAAVEEPNDTTSTRVETLALLYPPGLIGGYRNQVMRFTAFVRHAIQEQIPQMLLPSIYFSTTYEKDTTQRIFYPIRMKDVFDVDHWNEYASHSELPSLVESIDGDADCWTNDPADMVAEEEYTNETFVSTIKKYSKALDPASPSDKTPPLVLELTKRAEFLVPLKKVSLAIASGQAILKRPRQVNVIPLDLKCQHPKVYGGGKGGAGILWNDFLYKIRKEVNSSTVIHSVSQALTPAKQWRDVAHECIRQGSSSSSNQQQQQQQYSPPTPVPRQGPYSQPYKPDNHRDPDYNGGEGISTSSTIQVFLLSTAIFVSLFLLNRGYSRSNRELEELRSQQQERRQQALQEEEEQLQVHRKQLFLQKFHFTTIGEDGSNAFSNNNMAASAGSQRSAKPEEEEEESRNSMNNGRNQNMTLISDKAMSDDRSDNNMGSASATAHQNNDQSLEQVDINNSKLAPNKQQESSDSRSATSEKDHLTTDSPNVLELTSKSDDDDDIENQNVATQEEEKVEEGRQAVGDLSNTPEQRPIIGASGYE